MDASIDAAPPALTPGPTGDGAALPAPVQAQMERSFGADLSAVRIHEGPQAPARGALAYAQGADVHVAPGRYDPHGAEGQALLGHELAHVVQHAEGRGGALEAEADAHGAAAVRGEAVRPGAPPVTARRDPGAAIHRMIDQKPPTATDWAQIATYLDRTLINKRKQTFREAVTEYIAGGLDAGDTVKTAWEDLLGHVDEVGWEPTALARLTTIRTTINTAKRDQPDHPNKRGIQPNAERYETIPQTARSQAKAAALQADLLRDMFGGQYVKRARTFNGVALSRRESWSTSFMLGVLALPDGTYQAAHSGFLGRIQSAGFHTIVTAGGAVPVTHDGDRDYTALKTLYETQLRADRRTLPRGVDAKPDTTDNDKLKVMTAEESGNPAGVCAAPQVAKPFGAETSEFPPSLTGDHELGLTEVLVRKSAGKVAVNDAHKHPKEYDKHSVDVPSCLTCQHQLRGVLTKITNLRRNVLHREKVKLAEGDRALLYDAADSLREIAKKTGAAVATAVLGTPSVAQADDSDLEIQSLLGTLDTEIRGYRVAVETQAKERTKHPDFVEATDRTTVLKLAPMVAAERAAVTEHEAHVYEALWRKRMAVGKVIGGARYNDAREQASQAENVGTTVMESGGRREKAMNAQLGIEAAAREEEGEANRTRAHEAAVVSGAKHEQAVNAQLEGEAAAREEAGESNRTRAHDAAVRSGAKHEQAVNAQLEGEAAARDEAGETNRTRAHDAAVRSGAKHEQAVNAQLEGEAAARDDAGESNRTRAHEAAIVSGAKHEQAINAQLEGEAAAREEEGEVNRTRAHQAAIVSGARHEHAVNTQLQQEEPPVEQMLALVMQIAEALVVHVQQQLDTLQHQDGDAADQGELDEGM